MARCDCARLSEHVLQGEELHLIGKVLCISNHRYGFKIANACTDCDV